jgi:hypothetical protein
MKRVILMLCVISLFSCEKREELIKKDLAQEVIMPDNEGTGGIIIGNGGNGTNCHEGIRMVCDNLLEFSDLQQFWDTYECLELSYEQYNDNFEALHVNLNDSLYDIYCDSIGFDEDEPLLAFERNFNGFVSYRAWFAKEEDNWLNNVNLDPNTDPENNNFFDDDILMTLFNQDRAVKIAGVIYWLGKDGVIYQINNGDCQLLIELQKNPDIQNGNISIFNTNSNSSECDRWDREDDFEEYDGNKQFKWILSFKSWPWGTNSKSKIKSYKKKKNGSWKRYRTSLYVSNFGVAYDINCSDPTDYSNYKGIKRRKKLKTKNYWWGLTAQFQYETAAGAFEAKGHSIIKKLTF